MAVARERILVPDETAHTVRIPGIGHAFEFRYHLAFLPFLVLTGRLLFAFFFLWAGFSKVIVGGEWKGLHYFKYGDPSHPGELVSFLGFATGPLKSVFVAWSTSPTALDVIAPLVVVGQVLIGFGLLLGILTRLSFFSAAIMMFMFYLVRLWPPYNPFLDEHIFYIGIFAVLGALGAGRVLGVDGVIERTELVKKRPWLHWLLG